MFLKDDGQEFNIKESWTVNQKISNHDKEKKYENNPIPSNNSNLPNNNILNRKGNNKGNEKDLNSILNNAGKLAVGKNSVEDLLDDHLSKNIVKNLMQENNISNKIS